MSLIMNLFDKYGGSEFWSHFLNIFYSKISASQKVRHHFFGKNLSQIKSMLLSLLEVLLVSYTHFSEEMMLESHKGKDITNEEFEE